MAELSLFGVKMIMVPLGVAAFDHQYFNAVEMEDDSHILLSEAEVREHLITGIHQLEKVARPEAILGNDGRQYISHVLLQEVFAK